MSVIILTKEMQLQRELDESQANLSYVIGMLNKYVKENIDLRRKKKILEEENSGLKSTIEEWKKYKSEDDKKSMDKFWKKSGIYGQEKS